MKGIIRPRVEADGRVTVDMGEPAFGPEAVHFKSEGYSHLTRDKDTLWQVKTPEGDVWLSLVSMGNPHAVMVCGDTETACVETIGEALQKDEDFTQKVNVGFLQALSRSEARLRVYERGAGETLACGTGACAAACLMRPWKSRCTEENSGFPGPVPGITCISRARRKSFLKVPWKRITCR